MSWSATPSMVVMRAPSALTASSVQDLTALPLNMTVHAPQLVESQPTWVPRETEPVPEEVHEQQARLDVLFVVLRPLTVAWTVLAIVSSF